MRKCFFAGLVTLLPIIVTYVVIVFGLGIITSPFEEFVSFLLEKSHLLDDENVIYYVSKFLIIASLTFFIFWVGYFTINVLFHSYGYFIDGVVRKIPLIRGVYGSSKELVDILFASTPAIARKAALVPYPSKDQFAVGIVTGEFTAHFKDKDERFISVYVPGTPNATAGFMCSYRKEDVQDLDLTADEALKYIMSFANTTIALR